MARRTITEVRYAARKDGAKADSAGLLVFSRMDRAKKLRWRRVRAGWFRLVDGKNEYECYAIILRGKKWRGITYCFLS